jgi:hypothetical protein
MALRPDSYRERGGRPRKERTGFYVGTNRLSSLGCLRLAKPAQSDSVVWRLLPMHQLAHRFNAMSPFWTSKKELKKKSFEHTVRPHNAHTARRKQFEKSRS